VVRVEKNNTEAFPGYGGYGVQFESFESETSIELLRRFVDHKYAGVPFEIPSETLGYQIKLRKREPSPKRPEVKKIIPRPNRKLNSQLLVAAIFLAASGLLVAAAL